MSAFQSLSCGNLARPQAWVNLSSHRCPRAY